MDSLSLEQLKSIPWNCKYLPEGSYPPEPPVELIKEYCKTPFPKRNPEYSLFYTWFEIIKLVDDKSPKNILDAACGRGQISQTLYLKGNDVSACDVEDYFGADKNIKFSIADLNKTFPYNDNEFDYIINSTSLHYLNNSEHFFSECSRVLKKSGYIVFSIPNIQTIGSRLYFLKTGKFSEYSSAVLKRRNFLYPDYIFELLGNLNFSIEDIQGVVPVISLKIKIADLFLNKYFFKEKNLYKKYSSILVIKAKKVN